MPNPLISDRDLAFQLDEVLEVDALLAWPAFAEHDRASVASFQGACRRFAREALWPSYRAIDAEPPVFRDGRVLVHPRLHELWPRLRELGIIAATRPAAVGGQELPLVVALSAQLYLMAGNLSACGYAGLTAGAAHLVEAFGSPELRARYLPAMYDGRWTGTMALTEPHAGSSLADLTTAAVPAGDHHRLTGSKIFISGGDHDLAENIIHMVLARTPDAPPGTKGLSLFIVPKLRPDGAPNDVAVAGIEHKMGIKASATAQLVFGESGGCIGELVGEAENRGMPQMFHLMNYARIGVGLQGLALASSAYLNALEYARDRKQGSSIRQWKDATAPRVPIIEHADVRRMLLDMKARVEGIRALAVKLTMHLDRARALEQAGGDQELVEYHQGQVDLLVPLLKAYGSDQGFSICATAIQVYGGAGYLHDWPVEQYCRDSKIFSIYEGTNHIQAMDLVGRKLMQRGGANVQAFGKDVAAFVAAHKEHPALKEGVALLGQAMEALTATGGKFMAWFGGGRMEMVPVAANRFLEMMSETVVGWLLLEQAAIADAAAQRLPADHPDRAFYDGKRFAAQYFAFNVLPTVMTKAQMIAREDRSALDIPLAAFAPS
jgi:hypothetical protein